MSLIDEIVNNHLKSAQLKTATVYTDKQLLLFRKLVRDNIPEYWKDKPFLAENLEI
jgi:predicted house-cleaning noncanonical NTP pyrophosphatase (MazG superfamily)